MVKKPAKTTPTTPMTREQKSKLVITRELNRAEGTMNTHDQHDSRIARDGGSMRRLRS